MRQYLRQCIHSYSVSVSMFPVSTLMVPQPSQNLYFYLHWFVSYCYIM